MTDARLPGRWLMNMKIAALSDRAWRVFTSALMWSTEQGTDGEIPPLALRFLYPMDIPPSVIDELVRAELAERRQDGGFNVRDWGESQSTKAEVDHYREQARIRKQRERDRKRQKPAESQSESRRDRGSDVPRESSRQGEGSATQAKAGSMEPAKSSDDAVTSWPVARIPNSDAA